MTYNLATCANINWKDVQQQNVVNNVDMSSFRATWQHGPNKNQHTERHNYIATVVIIPSVMKP